jgi:hypothetical protein
LKLCKSAVETHEMLHDAFGEHSLSWTTVCQGYICFKAGWMPVEYNKHSGWPITNGMTESAENIWELIHKDCHWTISKLVDTVGISCEDCQEVLTKNLTVCWIAAKFVSWLTANYWKQRVINLFLELPAHQM